MTEPDRALTEPDRATAPAFEDFVRTATGHAPYPYQARLAGEGLPELLAVPTGAGKTLAAVLPWLYRRLVGAPQRTPRRLVYVLPLHSAAEQTYARVGEWLERLGRAEEVGLHLLAGGVTYGGDWRRRPERTAVLIGSHDLLMSRALMRGYAESSQMAPVTFGLLHSDTQWVFDERGLLGPARSTGARLQLLRERLGTPAPTATMWMDSTSGPTGLQDRQDSQNALSRVELSEADRRGAMSGRLNAVRRIRRLAIDPGHYVQGLAQAVDSAHLPGTRTIAVLNSVERARELYRALREATPGREVLLLQPHVRAAGRRDLPPQQATGDQIIVTTRALEAGPDLSSRTLLTELAPWSSIVQRAGRCNRYGEYPDGGDLLWCRPPDDTRAVDSLDDSSVEDAARWLTLHNEQAVTAAQLQQAPISCQPDAGQSLSQSDLLELFDTNSDAQPTRWICDPADHTVLIAWRDWESGRPPQDEADPARDELCPAPLADVRALLDTRRGWVRDQLDWQWRPVVAEDLRPGAALLLDARDGGYLPEEGWAPDSRTPVQPCGGGPAVPRSFSCTAWVSLDQHLMETEEEARRLVDALPGLAPDQQEAVARAARYHDLGKCHDAFQAMLRGGGGDPPDGLLAKSKGPYNTGTNSRPYFRHELVSALMLLHGQHWHSNKHWHGEQFDPRLVGYLAAAHHGHVRISARPRGDEAPLLLGVRDGDRTPPVELSSGERFPGQRLQTTVFTTGAPGSWTEQALALRDRADLGPFRLAYLEALVRIADWRSSARHDGPVGPVGPVEPLP
ncbi:MULTISPECIES: type I-G CRISPR-associated helicase/endonuclease Cas3g [unclassified Kitasatospora]|uniref:type I-G CRISPR-associated helicase/endonuclease Cas3g n=1 Tax=unclassified Kitasatospora TaxID=2633591 RepID=UPI00247383E7|nr:CRISPR-associated endonuclease Cas3'' [Kitasatospora sp. MAP12-44]